MATRLQSIRLKFKYGWLNVKYVFSCLKNIFSIKRRKSSSARMVRSWSMPSRGNPYTGDDQYGSLSSSAFGQRKSGRFRGKSMPSRGNPYTGDDQYGNLPSSSSYSVPGWETALPPNEPPPPVPSSEKSVYIVSGLDTALPPNEPPPPVPSPMKRRLSLKKGLRKLRKILA